MDELSATRGMWISSSLSFAGFFRETDEHCPQSENTYEKLPRKQSAAKPVAKTLRIKVAWHISDGALAFLLFQLCQHPRRFLLIVDIKDFIVLRDLKQRCYWTL